MPAGVSFTSTTPWCSNVARYDEALAATEQAMALEPETLTRSSNAVTP